MASFNQLDKSMGYLGSDNSGLSTQDNDQFYYGSREAPSYSSFGASTEFVPSSTMRFPQPPLRQQMPPQGLTLNGLRNGSAAQDGHYLPMQQQPQSLLPRSSPGPYGTGLTIGPSSMNHGMQYSRSLISEEDSGPPAPRADDALHFDAAGFPALIPSTSTPGNTSSNDASLGGPQQRVPSMSGRDPMDAIDSRADGDGKYGLLGLLDVLRMSDKDLNTLALGSDLTTFGLGLNSTESLFPTFSSPHIDSSNEGNQFVTPKCYLMQPPALKLDHLTKFTVETLFYMFYSMPRDLLQATAAQELYRREWRYHGELKVWLKARGPQELLQGQPGVPFVFFDVSTWEPKLFTSAFRGNLAAGLLSEEEVRVKAPSGLNLS